MIVPGTYNSTMVLQRDFLGSLKPIQASRWYSETHRVYVTLERLPHPCFGVFVCCILILGSFQIGVHSAVALVPAVQGPYRGVPGNLVRNAIGQSPQIRGWMRLGPGISGSTPQTPAASHSPLIQEPQPGVVVTWTSFGLPEYPRIFLAFRVLHGFRMPKNFRMPQDVRMPRIEPQQNT